jgi:hypothetical protein
LGKEISERTKDKERAAHGRGVYAAGDDCGKAKELE